MTALKFGKDINSYNAFAPTPSDNLFSANLDQDTAATFTVPSDYPKWICCFSIQPGSAVWVDFTGSTAASPATASFEETTSELNPASRVVSAGDEISLITPDTNAMVGVVLYGTE